MPLKQSLASFALYSLDQKYISSFSACCLTAKGERAGEGGGQKQKELRSFINNRKKRKNVHIPT